MKLHTARNMLSLTWYLGSLLILLGLFLRIPDYGEDSGAVIKLTASFIAPELALVTAFLFGIASPDKKTPLENGASFAAALAASLVHLLMIVIGLFLWSGPAMVNVERTGLGIAIISTLTIPALTFFFVRSGTPPPPLQPDHEVTAPPPPI